MTCDNENLTHTLTIAWENCGFYMAIDFTNCNENPKIIIHIPVGIFISTVGRRNSLCIQLVYIHQPIQF